jgi:dCMP deaminase
MRPTLDEYMMGLARAAAARSTCIRRSVGCVLADGRGRVLAVNYNGVAPKMPHCNEAVLAGADFEDLGGGVARPRKMAETFPHACTGWGLPPGQDSCEASHAEQTALMSCGDVWSIDTCHVTLSPCKACLKLLLNTSCRRIAFAEEWGDPAPRGLWLKAGRAWG